MLTERPPPPHVSFINNMIQQSLSLGAREDHLCRYPLSDMTQNGIARMEIDISVRDDMSKNLNSDCDSPNITQPWQHHPDKQQRPSVSSTQPKAINKRCHLSIDVVRDKIKRDPSRRTISQEAHLIQKS